MEKDTNLLSETRICHDIKKAMSIKEIVTCTSAGPQSSFDLRESFALFLEELLN